MKEQHAAKVIAGDSIILGDRNAEHLELTPARILFRDGTKEMGYVSHHTFTLGPEDGPYLFFEDESLIVGTGRTLRCSISAGGDYTAIDFRDAHDRMQLRMQVDDDGSRIRLYDEN